MKGWSILDFPSLLTQVYIKPGEYTTATCTFRELDDTEILKKPCGYAGGWPLHHSHNGKLATDSFGSTLVVCVNHAYPSNNGDTGTGLWVPYAMSDQLLVKYGHPGADGKTTLKW